MRGRQQRGSVSCSPPSMTPTAASPSTNTSVSLSETLFNKVLAGCLHWRALELHLLGPPFAWSGTPPQRKTELCSPECKSVDQRNVPLTVLLHLSAPSSIGETVVKEVIHTCNPNPCPSNYLCQVNRKGCLDEFDCQPFLCVPGGRNPFAAASGASSAEPDVCLSSGCKLGEASEFLVPRNSRVQVPTGLPGCYEVCTCGPSGRLENCMEMHCEDSDLPPISEAQSKGKKSLCSGPGPTCTPTLCRGSARFTTKQRSAGLQ